MIKKFNEIKILESKFYNFSFFKSFSIFGDVGYIFNKYIKLKLNNNINN